MTNNKKTFLRLHQEGSAEDRKPISKNSTDEVLACLQSFSQATGWGIRSTMTKSHSKAQVGRASTSEGVRVSKNSRANESAARWELVATNPADGLLDMTDNEKMASVSQQDAQALLHSIEQLVQRLEKAESAIREQQAILATEVAVTRNPDEAVEIADRLESILASCTRSIRATSAAIYLLDEATSELKMRACFNLPIDRLLAPARPLRGSLADLEAMLGNAVLIEDTACSPSWPSPENFSSAIVVPIGSVSMPQGTIWFWSGEVRGYTAAEVEMANMASGRVMNELEHSVLGVEVQQSRIITEQMDQASMAQSSRWPTCAPLHREMEVSGWSLREGPLGGSFHDWEMDPSENLVAIFGEAISSGPQGAIVATAINAITRSAWTQSKRPVEVLQSIGDYLFEGGEDDWAAHASLLQIDVNSGRGSLVNAGHNHIFIISHRGFRPLGAINTPLAQSPDISLQAHKFVLQPGELLIGMSRNLIEQFNLPQPLPLRVGSTAKSTEAYNKMRRERRALSKSLDQHELLHELREMIDEDAHEIARHISNRLPSLVNREGRSMDRSLLVIRNAQKAIGPQFK